MKRRIIGVLILSMLVMQVTACGKSNVDPGEPPVEAIKNNSSSNAAVVKDYDGKLINSAVGVVIGQTKEQLKVDMYNNAAVNTMLGYLSSSEMRFPAYTYSDEGGYAAQHVRGNYTRNDETEIADVKAGDLYLFSDGQLRLYFRDIFGVNITATPIGHFSDRSNIEKYVTEDYAANTNDSWGVKVYFMLTKLIK